MGFFFVPTSVDKITVRVEFGAGGEEVGLIVGRGTEVTVGYMARSLGGPLRYCNCYGANCKQQPGPGGWDLSTVVAAGGSWRSRSKQTQTANREREGSWDRDTMTRSTTHLTSFAPDCRGRAMMRQLFLYPLGAISSSELRDHSLSEIPLSASSTVDDDDDDNDAALGLVHMHD